VQVAVRDLAKVTHLLVCGIVQVVAGGEGGPDALLHRIGIHGPAAFRDAGEQRGNPVGEVLAEQPGVPGGADHRTELVKRGEHGGPERCRLVQSRWFFSV
jgi:hypothetical protein